MTLLITGIRYYAIGPDFVALGKHYVFTQADILVSFIGLTTFTVIMFLLAYWRFKNAIVT